MSFMDAGMLGQMAINNMNANNLANFNAGMANSQVGINNALAAGQYDPFASQGGFGAQTDYYSGLGASYGRAVGGEIYGAGAPQQQQQPDYSSYQPEQAFNPQGGAGGYTPGGNNLIWDGVSFVTDQGQYNGGGSVSYDISGNPTTTWGMNDMGMDPNYGWPTQPQQQQPQQNFADMWGDSGGRYPNSGYTPQVPSTPSIQQQLDAWPQGNAIWDPVYGDGSGGYGGGSNDLVFDGVSFVRGGGGMATGIDPMTGETTYGGARDGAAWALMAQQQQPDSFSPTGNYEQFRGPNLQDAINPLYQQRQEWATYLRDNPEDRFSLAARMHTEDQNDPNARMAVFESMLNADQATDRSPYNLKYYPNNGQYQEAMARLRANPELLNQVYAEMDRVLAGSNVGNYSTDWGSDNGPGQMVATNARKYFTPTWLAPGGEQFYRKDQTPSIAGQGIINDNLEWLRSAQDPWQYISPYLSSPGGG